MSRFKEIFKNQLDKGLLHERGEENKTADGRKTGRETKTGLRAKRR